MTDTVVSLRDQLLQIKALHDAGALAGLAYDSARAGLERRLVDLVTGGAAALPSAAVTAEPRAGKGLWTGALLVAAAVAAGGYAWTGSPGAIGGAATPVADAGAGAGAGSSGQQGVTPQQIAAMVDKLAARLADSPDDAEGWRMLARSYLVLDKPADAVTAFERYLKLRPDDAAALVDYADALAAKGGRGLEGEPLQLLQRALALEPGNLKALMLLGTAAFNRGDYAAAAAPWDRIAQLGPADNPLVQQAAQAAEEARRRGKLPPAPAVPSAAPSVAAVAPATVAPTASGAGAAAAQAVSGSVALAPALQARAAPGDTVFVFARAAQGGRMPLAIVRKQVKDLPFDFVLDDSLAMSPAARISGAGQVVVGARISKSGQAAPQAGDLQGLSEPVAVGSSGIRLTISSAIP